MQWFHRTGIILLYGGDLRNRNRISILFTYISDIIQAIWYTSTAFISHSSVQPAPLVLVTLSREKYPVL